MGGIVAEEIHVLLGDKPGDILAVGGTAKPDQVGNPVDQDGGFSASCTGQQQERPLGGHHRLLLHIVEILIAPPDHRPPCFQKSLLVLLIHSFSFNVRFDVSFHPDILS